MWTRSIIFNCSWKIMSLLGKFIEGVDFRVWRNQARKDELSLYKRTLEQWFAYSVYSPGSRELCDTQMTVVPFKSDIPHFCRRNIKRVEWSLNMISGMFWFQKASCIPRKGIYCSESNPLKAGFDSMSLCSIPTTFATWIRKQNLLEF